MRCPRRHWPLFPVAAVYLASLAVLPLGGIWINDVGNRVIQVKSIAANGYSDLLHSLAGPEHRPDI